MKELPAQQRKIVAYLCARRGAVSVKEIADACRLSQSQTAAQLHSLREKAFVRNEAIGRESWYELNEPLMRLVFEIKESRGRPIRLIVDFLRRWYNQSELRAKYAAAPMEASWTRMHFEAALTFVDLEPMLSPELDKLLASEEFEKALSVIKKAIAEDGRAATAQQWTSRGHCLCCLGRLREALVSFEQAIEIDPTYPHAHNRRGYVLGVRQCYAEALTSFDRVIELVCLRTSVSDPAIGLVRLLTSAYVSRGFVLNAMRRYPEALESIDRAIGLDSENAFAYYNRGRSFLAMGRWPDFLTNVTQALTSVGTEYDEKWGNVPSDCQLLLENSPPQVWSTQIAELVERYAEDKALKRLGQGLTESLPDLFDAGRSYEVTDAWNAAWQAAGMGHADLEIPLRLLDATVQWRCKPDRRILLRLPVEERRVLEKILPSQGIAAK